MRFKNLLALFMVAVFASGCVATTSKQKVFQKSLKTTITEFEKKHGIVVDVPSTWTINAPEKWIDGGKEKMFDCGLQLVSPRSTWGSFTILSVCSVVGEREFDLDSFVRASVWAFYYTGTSRIESGDIKSASFNDSQGREWSGLTRTDILYGAGESTAKVNHTFFSLKSPAGPVLGIRVIVFRETGMFEELGYVLNHITTSGKEKASYKKS